MSNYFYCYSKTLFHFIKAFGINYISIGVHNTTKTKYYIFPKSEKLDKIISLYNKVKHSI